MRFWLFRRKMQRFGLLVLRMPPPKARQVLTQLRFRALQNNMEPIAFMADALLALVESNITHAFTDKTPEEGQKVILLEMEEGSERPKIIYGCNSWGPKAEAEIAERGLNITHWRCGKTGSEVVEPFFYQDGSIKKEYL